MAKKHYSSSREKFASKLNWQVVILMQVERILISLSEGKENFINNIEGLDAVCMMFMDEKYEKELQELEKRFRGSVDAMRSDPTRSEDDSATEIMAFQYAMDKFKAMVRLIKRKNMGLEMAEEFILND